MAVRPWSRKICFDFLCFLAPIVQPALEFDSFCFLIFIPLVMAARASRL